MAIPDTLQDSLRARLDQLNFDQALTDACQAITVAEEVEVTDIQASGHFTTGFVYAVTGNPPQLWKSYLAIGQLQTET